MPGPSWPGIVASATMSAVSLPPPQPSSSSDAPAPDWYDDPWNTNGLRWWDGTQWTAHTTAPGWSDGAGARPATEVAGELERNERVGRWLRVVLAVSPVVQLANAFAVSKLQPRFRELLDDAQAGRALDPARFTDSGWARLSQALSLVSIALLVLRMVWMFRATTTARALGTPTRRTAGLACAGWIIPIVGLWWPYQSMSDVALPAGVASRRIGWWWVTELCSTLLSGLGTFIVLLGSTPVGAVLIGVGLAATVASVVLERALVSAVQAGQRSQAKVKTW